MFKKTALFLSDGFPYQSSLFRWWLSHHRPIVVDVYYLFSPMFFWPFCNTWFWTLMHVLFGMVSRRKTAFFWILSKWGGGGGPCLIFFQSKRTAAFFGKPSLTMIIMIIILCKVNLDKNILAATGEDHYWLEPRPTAGHASCHGAFAR